MIPVQRSCDVENIADFSRYYANSWVGWHDDDAATIRPCYVGGMLDNQNVQLRPLVHSAAHGLVVEKGFPAAWDTLKTRVDFGVPDIGITQDGPTVLFCSYTTPRVAKKGYRAREVMVTDFNSWEIRRKYSTSFGRDRYDWTWFAFNPEYSTLEQAEDKLAAGTMVGVPLSRTLGVYSSPKFKYSLLAYKRWTVGHVISPYLINIKLEYADYEEDIHRQTGAEVIVG